MSMNKAARLNAHVQDEGQARDDHRIERTVVAEDGVARELAGPPAEDPQDEHEMAVLEGEGEVLEGEIEVGLDRRAGRGHEGRPGREVAVEQDPADGDRQEQGGEDGAQQMGQPARPAGLGRDEAPGHPTE
jgi:hypothetical protein